MIKICIGGLFVNENQLYVGKNNNKESFMFVSHGMFCDENEMRTNRIMIQNNRIAASYCSELKQLTDLW